MFNQEEDYHKVLLREQWYLKSFPMRVFNWTLDFSVDAETSTAPIWLNFHYLPIHFFNKQSLFSIASVLSSLMQIDAGMLLLRLGVRSKGE